MIPLIPLQTAAFTSREFEVSAGNSPRGISSKGLSGAETIVIHRQQVDGTFSALTEADASLTATLPNTSIVASGVYKLVKPVTVSPAGGGID